VEVYVEVGAKKTFASALDWPGWARIARDEPAALQRLVDYGARYRRSMGLRAPGLVIPESTDELNVVERLAGGDSTDYGVLSRIPKADERPAEEADLERLIDLLHRAWAAFAEAADKAEGHELAPSGPRGGGRSLAKMRAHIVDAESAYVNAVGGKHDSQASWPELQKRFIEALHAKARGELPDVGPRGGRRWPVRYAVRRSAWHALDHAWELEDRVIR
jgi:hypothetical protein